jgi:hypothetical protein
MNLVLEQFKKKEKLATYLLCFADHLIVNVGIGIKKWLCLLMLIKKSEKFQHPSRFPNLIT